EHEQPREPPHAREDIARGHVATAPRRARQPRSAAPAAEQQPERAEQRKQAHGATTSRAELLSLLAALAVLARRRWARDHDADVVEVPAREAEPAVARELELHLEL